MKLLTLDIETSPMRIYKFSLKPEWSSIDQIIEDPRVICFGAKWYGEKKVHFYSEFHDGREVMLERAHALMDEADAIIHYNGDNFDIPWLRGEFLKTGLQPPAPHQNIDLYKVAKKQIYLPSHKLDYLARSLGLAGKVRHPGFKLWVDCLDGDPAAWRLMKRYCMGDVRLTEEVYDILLPLIERHPNHNLFSTGIDPLCPNCGSASIQRRGEARALTRIYQRYQCQDCGRWFRGTRSVLSTEVSP